MLKIDSLLIKLSILVVIQQLISVFKLNTTRFIIKNWFTKGEFPLFEWFKISFLLSINFKQIIGLIIIASFTLITFPLGIWIASYKLGISYPIMNIVGASIQMFTFPLNIYVMNKAINEMVLNKITLMGIGLIEASKIMIIFGCYLLYIGNRG